jgi:hypothetical protein
MGGMDVGVWGRAARGGVAVGSGEGAGKHRGWCKRWVDDGGRLPAPNERGWVLTFTFGGHHDLHSTVGRDDGDVIYDAPIVLFRVFTVLIGCAIELREGGSRGCCDDTSTMTMPLTTPSPWVTLHVALIAVVDVRQIRRN